MYMDSFKWKYESFSNGCDAIEEAGLWDMETYGEMDAFYANDMVSVILRLIGIDGKITQREVDYLNETFDFHYSLEELALLYKTCREDVGRAFDESFDNGLSLMRKINEKLADAYKELLFLILNIVAESDGMATSERAELQRLMDLCQ